MLAPVTRDPLTESARAAEEVAVESSPYPFLAFSDLSAELKDELRDFEGRGLFIAYPENQWGLSYVGCVSVTAIGPHGPEREFLDEENNLLLQRIGELAFDIKAAKEALLLEMHSMGECTRFPSEAAAREYLRTLLDNRSHLRVDPRSGEAWIFAPDRIDSDPRIHEMEREKSEFGRQLLKGRQGIFGVRWE